MQRFKTMDEFERYLKSLPPSHPLYQESSETDNPFVFRSDSFYKENGRYRNLFSVKMKIDMNRLVGMGKDYTAKEKNTMPKETVPRVLIDVDTFQQSDSIIWLGHSTILGHIDELTYIVDPMLSERASPLKCVGPKRFDGSLTPIEELPKIDVVLITHNHYDHMDRDSILSLQKDAKFILVPLDNAKALIKWGVDPTKIIELGWFDEMKIDGVQFSLCPTQHFSGRGLLDRDKALWGSWAIRGTHRAVYVSGDSGYNDHFKMIAERFGPFDIACMECGAYSTNWHEIHMMPEESVQAAIDVNAETMLPMHWAGFDLSTHAWDEPIQRALTKAHELGIPLTTPMIGQIVDLKQPVNLEKWWKKLYI